MSRGFASDNYAGAHPAVLAALETVNAGHVVSYGADPWTARLEEVMRGHFGAETSVFPVFNGTAANVLCLETLTRPWEAVIAASSAHIHVDECGAPERAGRKLLLAESEHGKLSPETVAPLVTRIGDEHAVQPRVISITESTELGTRYSRDEIAALAEYAHAHGLLLHVDGSRLANAAAALDCPVGALTSEVRVDAVSLGATKNGALGVEAVLLLTPDAVGEFKYLRKQSMQLASKMRFLSAQLLALYDGELWRENAAHANAMAARLRDALDGAVEFTHPVEANGLFAVLPPDVTTALQADWPFYVWDEATGEVRWMCAWDTTEEDVDAFAAAVRAALAPV